MRFDSLVHVTRDGRWINGRDDASLQRLMAELDRGRVTRACLVGLAGVVDNDYLLECAATHPGRLVAIAGIDPMRFADAGALDAEMRALARAGYAGVKFHPTMHQYDPLDARSLGAIRLAGEHRFVVFVDTLFRQRAHATVHAADVVDRIAHACPDAPIVLLHGGGPALLDVAEVVRVNAHLVLDLSFTLMRYAGSSLDADLRWVLQRLDERIVIGSDMPEYTPADAFAAAERLAAGLAPEKWANIAHRNLNRLFPAPAAAPAS